MGERMIREAIDPEAVGELVRATLVDVPSAQQRLAQRQRLVQAIESSARSHRGTAWLWTGLGTFATAIVLVLIIGRPLMREADTAVERIEPATMAQSKWFAAPAGGVLDVDVGDGTKLQLVDGARGRMTTDDAQQAMLVLESGRLQAEVEPSAGRRWTIEAGPYRVRVVGTVFSVAWDPNAGDLEVKVLRGKVEVVGPHGGSAIPVDAGHRLQASLPKATATLRAIEESDETSEEIEDETDDEIENDSPAVDETSGGRAAVSRRRAAAGAPTSWSALAKSGDYAEAFAAAEAAGFYRLVRTSSRADLERLADTARLAKKPTEAIAAYTAMRDRFGRSASSARAAFHLGRLAADQRNDPRTAARWFRTYLDESPKGSFAVQAKGRLIQTLLDAGDRAEAKAAARDYLQHHPEGAHAKLARSLAPP